MSINKITCKAVNGGAMVVFNDPMNIELCWQRILPMIRQDTLAMPFRVFSICDGEFVYTVWKI